MRRHTILLFFCCYNIRDLPVSSYPWSLLIVILLSNELKALLTQLKKLV